MAKNCENYTQPGPWYGAWSCERKATRLATRIKDGKEFYLCGYCARRLRAYMFKVDAIKNSKTSKP